MFGYAFGNYEGTKSVAELAPTFPSLALFYVRLLIWPFGMSPSYGLRYVPNWGDIRAWGGLIAVIVLTVAVWVATRRSRPLRFAAFWTAFCIWPVFNIRSFRPEYLVHQRYLYLASLSICLSVAWLAWHHIGTRKARWGLIATIAIIFSASNLMYNSSWRTDHDLWMRITAVDPANAAGFDWLAAEARRSGDVATATAMIERSIAAQPNSPYPYINRAMLLAKDRPVEAIPLFEKGIALHWADRSPDPVEIAKVLGAYGKCLMDAGRREEGVRAFVQAAGLPPYAPEHAQNAALVLLESGRGHEAYTMLEQAIQRHPGDALLVMRIVKVSAQLGRHADAIRWATVYIQRFPNDPMGPRLLEAAKKTAAGQG